jgi:hypothetical protein
MYGSLFLVPGFPEVDYDLFLILRSPGDMGLSPVKYTILLRFPLSYIPCEQQGAKIIIKIKTL